jgi:chemotaxis protein CheD
MTRGSMACASDSRSPDGRSSAGYRRITIHQGETRVSDDPGIVFTTLLGSCIAACLYDPVAKVGGINHFLLAEPGSGETDPDSLQRYGVYAMEVLINALLAKGATRSYLRARLYGGASLHDGFRDIGATNALFARRFLQDERILLVGEDVGDPEKLAAAIHRVLH